MGFCNSLRPCSCGLDLLKDDVSILGCLPHWNKVAMCLVVSDETTQLRNSTTKLQFQLSILLSIQRWSWLDRHGGCSSSSSGCCSGRWATWSWLPWPTPSLGGDTNRRPSPYPTCCCSSPTSCEYSHHAISVTFR